MQASGPSRLLIWYGKGLLALAPGAYLAQHLLGQLWGVLYAANVHPALQAALELAQPSASRQNLTLHHNLRKALKSAYKLHKSADAGSRAPQKLAIEPQSACHAVSRSEQAVMVYCHVTEPLSTPITWPLSSAIFFAAGRTSSSLKTGTPGGTLTP